MISSNDAGEYTCGDCGNRWEARERYLWWPVRLKWGAANSSAWFKVHGWQVGCDGIERRLYGRTLHLGRLKVMLGPPA